MICRPLLLGCSACASPSCTELRICSCKPLSPLPAPFLDLLADGVPPTEGICRALRFEDNIKVSVSRERLVPR